PAAAAPEAGTLAAAGAAVSFEPATGSAVLPAVSSGDAAPVGEADAPVPAFDPDRESSVAVPAIVGGRTARRLRLPDLGTLFPLSVFLSDPAPAAFGSSSPLLMI
ncbi:hypothetical protein ACFOHM_00945, partial [Microbaculum marinum]